MAAWLRPMRDTRRRHAIDGIVSSIAVCDLLEPKGLEVYLVKAQDAKNLPGFKSDAQEL